MQLLSPLRLAIGFTLLRVRKTPATLRSAEAALQLGLQAVFMAMVAIVAIGITDTAHAQLAATKAPSAEASLPAVSEERIQAAIMSGWSNAAPDWLARLRQDETMKACSLHDNAPPAEIGREIRNRERGSIRYPSDGNLVGDWKKGERTAQSGYGLRFTDYPPPAQANGGNCYACHQLDPKEVSYGTIGPSLVGYGRIRKFGAPLAKVAYDKIYNAHESQACSLMPRFGANGTLSEEQIKDLVALLVAPDSPVNK